MATWTVTIERPKSLEVTKGLTLQEATDVINRISRFDPTNPIESIRIKRA